jgi:hypothetical protein
MNILKKTTPRFRTASMFFFIILSQNTHPMKNALYASLLSASLLVACGSRSHVATEGTADSTSTDTTASATAPDAVSGVTMSISPRTFKTTAVGQATLTIANQASGDVTCGDPFGVEYLNGGNWEKVTLFDSVMFTAMAHVIAPGKSQEFPIQLQPMPYDYKPGQYRIVKGAQHGEKAIQLTAPFTVE